MKLNIRRPRRNRKTEALRQMVQETTLAASQLIYPLFVTEGKKQKIEIKSMPNIFRWSQDLLLGEIESCLKLGVKNIVLFPALSSENKDELATESYNPNGLYLKTLREVKKRFPELCLMTDIAMDPYSTSGHDGYFKDGSIHNDKSLEILGKMAVAQAEAGADVLGPSDMMDGRVGYIRTALDKHGHTEVAIMSYTAKYASAFYGPFREALDSAPKKGDKKTYQMNPGNRREALVEGRLDVLEGADVLMVKPALSYLDIISDLKTHFNLPIAAYNVSGEYSMVKAADEKGWCDGAKIRDEILLSIRRAGADIILTYFAKEWCAGQG